MALAGTMTPPVMLPVGSFATIAGGK